jgi:hypothetical protein
MRVIYCDMRPDLGCKDTAKWFKRHGLDWLDFKRNGIDIEDLRAPGDHLDKIDKIEANARRREAQNGRR